mmetsp:Transcript_45970/g.107335  ORF Transcript_45970/g.107335 Transcript_45970/m.107335 type:complete len:309 (-) Transcript_45970:547-1473(-)
MTGAHAHTHGDWSHIGGSPPGHTLPGVLFLVLGVHWTFAILWQLLCGRPEEASRAWYPLPMTWRRPLPSGRLPQRRGVPIEPVLKVILPSLGAAVEVYFKTFGPGRIFFRSLYNERGEFQHVGEWAHAAMYAFFILSGCADLAMEGVAACWDAGKGRARTLEANSVVEETGEECENADAKANADSGAWPGRSVARRVELAALGMAFGHTAIQLVFHASMPNSSEFFNTAHWALVVILAVATLATVVEAWVDDPAQATLAALVRSIFTISAGVWFIHIARYYKSVSTHMSYSPNPGRLATSRRVTVHTR